MGSVELRAFTRYSIRELQSIFVNSRKDPHFEMNCVDMNVAVLLCLLEDALDQAERNGKFMHCAISRTGR
jgi:hypothetical protein